MSAACGRYGSKELEDPAEPALGRSVTPDEQILPVPRGKRNDKLRSPGPLLRTWPSSRKMSPRLLPREVTCQTAPECSSRNGRAMHRAYLGVAGIGTTTQPKKDKSGPRPPRHGTFRDVLRPGIPSTNAADVVALETKIAEAHWTRVESAIATRRTTR